MINKTLLEMNLYDNLQPASIFRTLHITAMTKSSISNSTIIPKKTAPTIIASVNVHLSPGVVSEN